MVKIFMMFIQFILLRIMRMGLLNLVKATFTVSEQI